MMGSLVVGCMGAERFSREETSTALRSGRFKLNGRHKPSYHLEAASKDGEKVSGLIAHGVKTDAVVENLNHDLVRRQISLQAKGAAARLRKGVPEDVGARLVEGEYDIVDDVGGSDELFQIRGDRSPGRPQKVLVCRKAHDKRKIGRLYRRNSSPSCISVPYPRPLCAKRC